LLIRCYNYATMKKVCAMKTVELDVLPGLGILESDPSPRTTAFGLLADLIDIVKSGAA